MAQLKAQPPAETFRTLKSRLSASLVRRTTTALPAPKLIQPPLPQRPQTDQQRQPTPRQETKPATKPTNDLRLIKKLPEAKVFGEELLGKVFQTNDVELILNDRHSFHRTGSSSSSVDASIAEEGCVFGKATKELTSCLKTGGQARSAQIAKSVAFLGTGKGSEVTSIFLYEPTKVKLPWTGPSLKGNGAKERAGIYLSQQTKELARKQIAIRTC